MNNQFSLNQLQAAFVMLLTERNYLVEGRGAGKSTMFGHMMHQIVRTMPGASGIVTAKNISHVLTSILPSAFHHLERMGYIRDVHYVIGEAPPKAWGLPYEPPVKNFDNYVTFMPLSRGKRPTGFHLTSQERKGSGRGFNTDFSLTDETLRLDKAQLDAEQNATLRANVDLFTHIPYHRGQYHSTSMPDTPGARWILNEANYYLEDYGINLWAIWKQVVTLQLELVKCTEANEFARIWNEIQRLRKAILPRQSKDGKRLFVVGNAFDNIEFLKFSYIKKQYDTLPLLIFLTEILNALVESSVNSFYPIEEERNVYYDSWDDSYTLQLAITTQFDMRKLAAKNSAFLSRRYYNPNAKIYLFFDWGGTVSFVLAAQYDEARKMLFIIKEFYVLPPGEMPKRLMGELCDFFEPHADKNLIFLRDTLGDDKSRSIQGSNTINQDAQAVLRKRGWGVSVQKHKHKEPPMYEKWQLMQKVFSGNTDHFGIQIDGNNCRYLVLALKSTEATQKGNEFAKNKSNERKKEVDQREATHSTDALDKGCYFIDNHVRKGASFIPSV